MLIWEAVLSLAVEIQESPRVLLALQVLKFCCAGLSQSFTA